MIKEDLEGQTLDQEGRIILGLKAGPERSVENLIHEMCHLVEIDDQRMTSYGWGLNYGALIQYIMGQRCQEFVTIQATKREIRCWAYQMNVYKALGINETVSDLVKVAVHMGDWPILCYNDKIGFKGDKEKALKWVEDEVKKAMGIYTFERFESEWFRKMGVLTKRHKEAVPA